MKRYVPVVLPSMELAERPMEKRAVRHFAEILQDNAREGGSLRDVSVDMLYAS